MELLIKNVYSPSESSGSDEGMDDTPVVARRYPERVRRNVVIPGAIHGTLSHQGR